MRWHPLLFCVEWVEKLTERELIKPLVGTLDPAGMFLLQRLGSGRGSLKSVLSQTDERLGSSGFVIKGTHPRLYPVALQFFVDIGRHQNDMKILPHAQRADRQVHVHGHGGTHCRLRQTKNPEAASPGR